MTQDPYNPYDPENAANLYESTSEVSNTGGTDNFAGILLLVSIGSAVLCGLVFWLLSTDAVIGFMSTQWIRGALSYGVLASGYGAYKFKQGNQRLYGATEIGFGVASAISVFLRFQLDMSLFAQWATIIGCTYVVAQGFNDISDARAKTTKKVLP